MSHTLNIWRKTKAGWESLGSAPRKQAFDILCRAQEGEDQGVFAIRSRTWDELRLDILTVKKQKKNMVVTGEMAETFKARYKADQ